MFSFNIVDQALTPGCLTLTWVSPNIDEYCQNVFKELENLDLVLRRANDLVTYRIEAVLNDMSNLTLCEINDDEPISAEDFLEKTIEMCTHGAQSLQAKSHNIEEATEELIELLYPEYKNNPDQENEQDGENLEEKEELEDTRNSLNGQRQTYESSTNKSESKAAVTQVQRAARKRREARAAMQEIANELFNFFNHKNVDSIIKLVRTTLERLRKRINSSQNSLLSYVDAKEKTKKEIPVFKVCILCFVLSERIYDKRK